MTAPTSAIPFKNFQVLLAPMAGVTDKAFRQICIEHGADLTYTEMVSAKGLAYANDKTSHLLDLAPNETQVCVQVFGHEPEIMAAQAASIEERLGNKLSVIDVNMGCPARKIAGKGDGSALMKDPVLAATIIRALKKHVTVPVTAKFRRGYYEGQETCVEFARYLEDAGADGVTVHGRYATQLYRGSASWDAITRVKQALKIPVVGNGDITSGNDVSRMKEVTGCDSVMIGRGAQGNPWIFEEVRCALAGKPYSAPSIEERMAVAIQHTHLLAQEGPRAVLPMRKHGMWYVSGFKDASQLRRRISEAVTEDDFVQIFTDAALTTSQTRPLDRSRSIETPSVGGA